jgi:RimJ/RimL family protein N-acetyltransferase
MNIPTLYSCRGGFGFRKLVRRDLPALSELKAETWSNTHTATIVNSEDQDRWFDSMQTDVNQPTKLFLTLTAAADSSTEAIGFFKIANVDYINRTADVGWDLLAAYRGKGIGQVLVTGGASFCFNFLNLRRLTAEILATNVASQRRAESAGFVMEGVKREAVYVRIPYKHGPLSTGTSYVDSQIWGLLAGQS